MALGDLVALLVRLLLVLLVVAVVGVDDVGELANVGLHVRGLDVHVVQARVLHLVLEVAHLAHEASAARLALLARGVVSHDCAVLLVGGADGGAFRISSKADEELEGKLKTNLLTPLYAPERRLI